MLLSCFTSDTPDILVLDVFWRARYSRRLLHESSSREIFIICVSHYGKGIGLFSRFLFQKADMQPSIGEGVDRRTWERMYYSDDLPTALFR
jgi:hypothetical protein